MLTFARNGQKNQTIPARNVLKRDLFRPFDVLLVSAIPHVCDYT
jgi:hypothetical protein